MKKSILLICAVVMLACTSAPETDNAARIKPYKEDPRYWQYRGGPVLLVGGSIDDNLFQLPFLREHLDTLASVGGNYIRNTMSSRVDKGFEVYRFKQLPGGKYDLEQWNDEYWQRFQNLLQLTEKRGIIVQIEVWDRFDYSREHWEPNPWNPANNVNYTFAETGFEPEYPEHPGRDLHPFFHAIPGMQKYEPRYDVFRKYQERFVAKMLSCSLDYGNVLYCMSNETSTSEKWGQYWMRFIRNMAAEKKVDVYATDMFDDFWKGENSAKVRLVFDNPDIYDFADISQVNSRNFDEIHWQRMLWLVSQARAAPRPCNHTKIYGSGFTSFGSGSPADGVERFWRNILGGSASSRFHRPTSGNGLNALAQASIKAVRKMGSLVKMWEVEPDLSLLSGAGETEVYLAARPGDKYVLYFTEPGSVVVDLSKAAGLFKARWISISTGEWDRSEEVIGGSKKRISTPGSGGWLAVLTR
jgi:hypothetical protein